MGRAPKLVSLTALVGVIGFGVYMAVWSAIQGPSVAWRVLWYGDSDVFDFRHAQTRPVAAPPVASRLLAEPLVPAPSLRSEFDRLLTSSDSLALVVLQGQTIREERYFNNHLPDILSLSFSVSKSVLGALIGIAVADGVIDSPDTLVTRYVPELAGRDGFDEVRIRDILWMAGQLDYVEDDNPFGEHVRLNYTARLEREILSFTRSADPAAKFAYKSGENALLGLVLARALHPDTISDFTRDRLWKPMGMEYPALWSLDRAQGLERTWCCLAATARDLARFGAMYRDGGTWNGRQVVAPEWVAASLQPGPFQGGRWAQSPYAQVYDNYGYQWWLIGLDRGDFAAIGKDGQFIYVDPGTDVVIVRLGRGWGRRPDGGHANAGDWIEQFRALADALP